MRNLPRVYGLPKIHKHDRPLRPIVLSINSPTYNLAKMLSRILNPLVGKSCHSVQNSHHFVQMLHKFKLQLKDIMVSFDVVSLFTKVLIMEAVDIISDLLPGDSNLGERTDLTPDIIIDLLKKCLATMYFQYQLHDSFYQQTEGAAMGSPLFPVIANGVF